MKPLLGILLVIVLILVLDNELPSTTSRTRTNDRGPDGAGSTIFILWGGAWRHEWLL